MIQISHSVLFLLISSKAVYPKNPYSIRLLTPFYTENHRMLTQFKSDNFGEIVISEIGAFTVGSIKQQYEPDALVGKGEHQGFF